MHEIILLTLATTKREGGNDETGKICNDEDERAFAMTHQEIAPCCEMSGKNRGKALVRERNIK